jgi:hypothetical protein
METKKKRMTLLLSWACSIIIFVAPIVTTAQILSKVAVVPDGSVAIQALQQNGFDLDHIKVGEAGELQLYVSPSELEQLRTLAIPFTVLVANVKQDYSQRLNRDLVENPNPQKNRFVADGFDLGSMGGYYTYEEIGQKLDAMRLKYPTLISEKVSIGTSIEGRDIWMAKISDNPDIDEDEPAAYFDALHHAREPVSMAATVNYMFWLLEHYETDASITHLIDNREIYFVPVVNPDGYEYNRSTNPNGGGMWRKNRNPNSGSCVGVDLNRNYAFGYANDGSCSSTDPCSGTYRGEGAFSEPEAVAVRDLLAAIQPNTAFSTHSTAGTYLMPYGYNTNPPAFDIYSEWASAFLNENDYTYGVTFQMLGYTSCGTTRDYLHSEGIYGWTPEIDGSGFWPLPSEIFDLVAENVRPFLYQTWISGAYIDVQSHQQLGAAVPGETFPLLVEVKNVGVGASAQDVSVQIIASSPEVQVPTAVAYGEIPARQRATNTSFPFQISIDPSFQESGFTLTVNTFQDGVLNESSEIPITIGTPQLLFIDDAEAGAANWVTSGNGISWGIVTDDSYSGSACFGDSNGGNSQNNTLNYFELANSFNLNETDFPYVEFNYKHALENVDSVAFQVSTDNGVTWENLNVFTFNAAWQSFRLNLTPYKTAISAKFRFQLLTDNFIPGDGFYFDDFKVIDYEEGILSVPEAPNLTQLSVYPNPFSESITIKTTAILDDSGIFLVDMLGRKLPVSVSQTNGEWQLTGMESFGSGIYFLYVRDIENAHRVIKLVKKK